VQRSRRAHDAETRLWQAEHKLVDAQSKLTGANLEIQRLRSAAEQHDHDMLYVRRLLEREQREKNALEAEVLSLRYGLGDGAALSWKQIAARCDLPEKQAQLAQSRALRKLRKQRSLRQLQAFCDHEEWEHQGRMSPGESYSTR